MIIFGIDPGISGAISVLENKKVIEVYDMPTMIDGKKNRMIRKIKQRSPNSFKKGGPSFILERTK